MIISLMGLMLPVVMLSGYAFPIANMPLILQIISNIVPAKWYIIMVKECNDKRNRSIRNLERTVNNSWNDDFLFSN